jgi:hypothetical protein
VSWKVVSKIVFVGALALAATSEAAVWSTTNQWSEAKEREFGKFINNLPLDFFSRPGTAYSGIPTDCADAAYFLRTIFAFENGLPVDFFNWENRDLSNTSSDFDSFPAGRERLLKFMNRLRRATDTGTLIRETYPIAINRSSVRPGSMFLHSPKKGEGPKVYNSAHVFYVQNVANNGLVTYISSTVPIAVRNLNARNGYVFTPFNINSGYRAWKWPGTMTQALETRNNGSTEQFRLGRWKTFSELNMGNDGGRAALANQMDAWSDAVRARLQGSGAGRTIDPTEELNAVIGNIMGGIRERIKIVQAGAKLYQSRYGGRGCMSEKDYDDLSTPSRDTRIQHELQYLEPAATRYVQSQGAYDTQSALTKLYAKYRFEIAPGYFADLNQMSEAFLTAKALSISEPEHSIAARWGIGNLMVKSQWACPRRASQYHGAETIDR